MTMMSEPLKSLWPLQTYRLMMSCRETLRLAQRDGSTSRRRNFEILDEMRQAAASHPKMEVNQARALRRHAELLDKGQNETDWRAARDILDNAADLLAPLLADHDARLELGRILILFCEIQCHRKRIGQLNTKLAKMQGLMQGVPTRTRIEEHAGESYGEERAAAVLLRVAELRGDFDVKSDDT